jgi:hypothetical protein
MYLHFLYKLYFLQKFWQIFFNNPVDRLMLHFVVSTFLCLFLSYTNIFFIVVFSTAEFFLINVPNPACAS